MSDAGQGILRNVGDGEAGGEGLAERGLDIGAGHRRAWGRGRGVCGCGRVGGAGGRGVGSALQARTARSARAVAANMGMLLSLNSGLL